MSCEISQENGHLLLTPEEEITMVNAGALRAKAEAALAEYSPCPVYIDLSATSFIDSTGIGSLLALNRQSKDLGFSFALLNPSTRVRKILNLVQLTNHFTILDAIPDPDTESASG